MLALESLGEYPKLTTYLGDHSDRVTPVPIPNTEVKPVSADGTWGEIPWESRTSPDYSKNASSGFLPVMRFLRFRLDCNIIGPVCNIIGLDCNTIHLNVVTVGLNVVIVIAGPRFQA